ncbi:hypothetical protein RQP53_24090 [Paucibacter sp. APW11]|uniref:DUF4440 domain-containing protein n=1 Tax=Roseateles aquae TaxID=3077235 RepID=A0ABU3PIV6_9BURK|nr:hypothetical protein [Paucibacter sp. APW11]MDT9002384.1 hypothetical protein [Paucibacter sp. APW11]
MRPIEKKVSAQSCKADSATSGRDSLRGGLLRARLATAGLALLGALMQGCASHSPTVTTAVTAPVAVECAEGVNEAISEEIGKRHRKLLHALNAGNIDEALTIYAPSAIVLAPSREQHAYRGQAWVRLYLQEQLIAHGARFATEDLFNGIASHCGIEVYGGQYRLTLDGVTQMRPYLIVWRHINSEWMVIAQHVDLGLPAAR